MSEVVPLTREERIEERKGAASCCWSPARTRRAATGNGRTAGMASRRPTWSRDCAATAAARTGTSTAGGKDEIPSFPSRSVVFVVDRTTFISMCG